MCLGTIKCKELTGGILDNIINFLYYLFASGNLTELLWNIPRNHKVNFIRFYRQGVGVKFAQSEYFRNLTFLSLIYKSIIVFQGPIRCVHLFSVTINKRTTSFTKRIELQVLLHLPKVFPVVMIKKKRYTWGLEVAHYDRLFDFVRNFIFLYLIML